MVAGFRWPDAAEVAQEVLVRANHRLSMFVVVEQEATEGTEISFLRFLRCIRFNFDRHCAHLRHTVREAYETLSRTRE